jgi:RND family efflux transporter MFP subunit
MRSLLLFLIVLLVSAAQAQTPVRVATPVTAESAETLRLTGNFTARREVSLSPQLSGRIERMQIEVGDRVGDGDLIAVLDTRLAELQTDRAAALRDEAIARLTEAQRLAEEGRRLTGSQFLPDTEVRAREAGVAFAEAALRRAEADLAIEQEQLERHQIRAPFAGVISARLAERGDWVEPGRAVVDLVQTDELWLDVRVPQSYWRQVSQGEIRIVARADAMPDATLDAEIAAVVPVSDPAARTFLLRLRVVDEAGNLTPGMSAQVELALTSAAPQTRIPRDALLRQPDGSALIWLLDSGSDEVRRQVVNVRRWVGDQAELFDVLPDGVQVVIRGNEALSEGERVRVVGD